jgi:hypothetical protein
VPGASSTPCSRSMSSLSKLLPGTVHRQDSGLPIHHYAIARWARPQSAPPPRRDPRSCGWLIAAGITARRSSRSLRVHPLGPQPTHRGRHDAPLRVFVGKRRPGVGQRCAVTQLQAAVDLLRIEEPALQGGADRRSVAFCGRPGTEGWPILTRWLSGLACCRGIALCPRACIIIILNATKGCSRAPHPFLAHPSGAGRSVLMV